eukprot:m.220022 g.220022  ORF g.220022 m.220022 type:complete len:408 (+) comp22267_c15_seq2:230-1453(+)
MFGSTGQEALVYGHTTTRQAPPSAGTAPGGVEDVADLADAQPLPHHQHRRLQQHQRMAQRFEQEHTERRQRHLGTSRISRFFNSMGFGGGGSSSNNNGNNNSTINHSNGTNTFSTAHSSAIATGPGTGLLVKAKQRVLRRRATVDVLGESTPKEAADDGFTRRHSDRVSRRSRRGNDASSSSGGSGGRGGFSGGSGAGGYGLRAAHAHPYAGLGSGFVGSGLDDTGNGALPTSEARPLASSSSSSSRPWAGSEPQLCWPSSSSGSTPPRSLGNTPPHLFFTGTPPDTAVEQGWHELRRRTRCADDDDDDADGGGGGGNGGNSLGKEERPLGCPFWTARQSARYPRHGLPHLLALLLKHTGMWQRHAVRAAAVGAGGVAAAAAAIAAIAAAGAALHPLHTGRAVFASG